MHCSAEENAVKRGKRANAQHAQFCLHQHCLARRHGGQGARPWVLSTYCKSHRTCCSCASHCIQLLRPATTPDWATDPASLNSGPQHRAASRSGTAAAAAGMVSTAAGLPSTATAAAAATAAAMAHSSQQQGPQTSAAGLSKVWESSRCAADGWHLAGPRLFTASDMRGRTCLERTAGGLPPPARHARQRGPHPATLLASNPPWPRRSPPLPPPG